MGYQQEFCPLCQDLQKEQNRKEKAEATNTPKLVKQSTVETIAYLEQAIAKLNQDIDTHIDNHPKLKEEQTPLQSIEGGVGQVISRQMLSLFNTKHFKTAKQVSAFLGLIPNNKNQDCLRANQDLPKQAMLS